MKKETLAKQLARKVVPRDLWPQYSRHLHVKFKADQIVYLVQNIAIALEPLFWAIAGAYLNSIIFKNKDDRDFNRRFKEAYENCVYDNLKEVKTKLKRLKVYIRKNPNKIDSKYKTALSKYESAVRKIDSPLKARRVIKRIPQKEKKK